MTLKIALTNECPKIFKLKSLRIGIGKHYRNIEINEIAVVGRIALRGAYSMRVVTCRTRSIVFQMFLMKGEAFVVKNAFALMTFVAEGIAGRAFDGVIGGLIL